MATKKSAQGTGTPRKKAAPKATKKAAEKKPTQPKPAKRHRVFGISFASVYPLYVEKVTKKNRTQQELDEVLRWLTGYTGAELQRVIDTKVALEAFFEMAPRLNPNVGLITGVVCGVRVEDIEDPLMQKIRYMDKLVDELAKGRKMESILRGS